MLIGRPGQPMDNLKILVHSYQVLTLLNTLRAIKWGKNKEMAKNVGKKCQLIKARPVAGRGSYSNCKTEKSLFLSRNMKI
jgi:hypothetical protein